jgi:hypothetical protein
LTIAIAIAGATSGAIAGVTSGAGGAHLCDVLLTQLLRSG